MKKPFRQHRPLFAAPLPESLRKPKRRWMILPVAWLALKRMAMVLGFIMILNLLFVLIALPAILQREGAPTLPQEMVLFMPLEDGFEELPEHSRFSNPFAPEGLTVRHIVEALDAAATDDRVKGLVARMRGGNFALTHSHEVREALKRFRAAGKTAWIYSASYGDGGGGLGRYYLASAFDEIWMQPLGVVSISGVSAEIPFMRGALDKLGVRPQFFQRENYKTAYESLTNKSISRYNKEMMERLIGDIRAEMLETLPTERGIDKKRFERLVDKGVFTAPEALKAGLITKADYGDVLLKTIAQALTGQDDPEELNFVDLKYYAADTVARHRKSGGNKPEVALIYAVGTIMPDDSSGGGLMGGGHVAAASEIAPAIMDAAEDKNVKAVVLRIDSPGGSPSASESILRAVKRTQEKGKPVIVSMGPAAASGGYWIATSADRIFALPTTLTGSIGVVGGKFSIAGLSEKLGVNWDKVSWGKNAGIWSLNTPFDAGESERMNALMDGIYENFIQRVATGRKKSPAEVRKIAGGRVWTGRAALKVGLVDEIGGLNDALDHAATSLGQKSREDLDIGVFPKSKTPFEKLVSFLEGQVETGRFIQWQSALMNAFQPALENLDAQALEAQLQARQPVNVYEPLRLD